MDYIVIENEKIGKVKAKLLVDKNPKTCKTIWDSLPLELNLSRWGEELYGNIPVSIDPRILKKNVRWEILPIGYRDRDFVFSLEELQLAQAINPKQLRKLMFLPILKGIRQCLVNFDPFLV